MEDGGRKGKKRNTNGDKNIERQYIHTYNVHVLTCTTSSQTTHTTAHVVDEDPSQKIAHCSHETSSEHGDGVTHAGTSTVYMGCGLEYEHM